jgi:hypothetical protein
MQCPTKGREKISPLSLVKTEKLRNLDMKIKIGQTHSGETHHD